MDQLKSFEKCQCVTPGFCPMFNRIMGLTPPDWKWCKKTTSYERKKYFDLLNRAPDSSNKQILKLLNSTNDNYRWFLLYYLSETKYHSCKKSIENQRIKNEKIINYIKGQKEERVDFNNIEILCLGHRQSQFDSIEDRPYLKKVDLNSINAGEYSDNKWAESRAFFAKDLFREDVDFIGFTTASWNEKYEAYSKIDNFHNWENAKVLLRSKPEDKIILCADSYCPCRWPNILSDFLRGDSVFIVNNFLKLIKLKNDKHTQVPFSNQLICHKSIIQEYRQFLRDNDVLAKIDWIVERYSDLIRIDNIITQKYHSNRLHAYFMEMTSCFWLASTGYNFIPNVYRKELWYNANRIIHRIKQEPFHKLDSSKLHVSMITNKLFLNMANVSCSSFNNKNIVIHLNNTEIQSSDSDNGLFSNSWYKCLANKIKFSALIFKHMQYNDVLLVCDADVYCFNADNVFALKYYLQNYNLDMIGMPDYFDQYYQENPTERLKINCGFFLVRKTKNSKDFFNKILSHNFTSFTFGEQDIVNEIILKQNHGLNYEILSPKEYVMGCHLDRALDKQHTMTVLHTTCTHNLKEKQEQIDRVINYYNMEPIEWTCAQLTKKEIIHYNEI